MSNPELNKITLDFTGCNVIYVQGQTQIILKERERGNILKIIVSSRRMANFVRPIMKSYGHKIIKEKEEDKKVIMEVEIS